MSTHSVDVIKIEKIETHPHADKLDIVWIGEYTCCTGKGNFKQGDLAVYIEPDYVIDTTKPEFSFLYQEGKSTKHRVKVKRLRGIYSQGFLFPAPPEFKEGDNVMEHYGIERYEPPVSSNGPTPGTNFGSQTEKAPEGNYPVYDLENWRRFSKVLEEGEEVYITEKLDGTNARFLYDGNKFHLGSRTRWVTDDGNNVWSVVLNQDPFLKAFLLNHPGLTVYGEIFGWVQSLRYGHEQGEYTFAAFDILENGQWWDWGKLANVFSPLNHFADEFSEGTKIISAPLLYVGSYKKELIPVLAEGPSACLEAKNIREGIVIKPTKERWNPRTGRVALKCVSNEYLMKS